MDLEFDGDTWQYKTTNALNNRTNAALAYDPDRGKVVLFGGKTDSTSFGDTWTWDGSSWAQVTTQGPAPRYDASMTYDPTRGGLLLVGGADTSGYFGDTWLLVGTEWRCLDGGEGNNYGYSVFRRAVAFDPNRNAPFVVGESFRVFMLVPRFGDLNCDGSLNGFDIDPFILALSDPATYAATYPDCDILHGDSNGDGSVNGFDITGFIESLGN